MPPAPASVGRNSRDAALVSDDGMVSKLETAMMDSVFGLIIYLLVQHR
jgi:hypothetical protein